MKGIKKKIRDNKYLNWILIFSNWLFQSIIHADITEKIYKISFTLILWIVFFIIGYSFNLESFYTTLIISFIISHTINWLVNGNIYNLLIHRLLLVSLTKKDLFEYVDALQKRLINQDWILYSASFGSICNGNLKDSSDIDVSIVRKPGFKNAVQSILFSVKEKKKADIKRIPLEIYISDTPRDSIKRFRGENNPVILFDPQNVIHKYYNEKLTILEAKKINGVG